ncbi:MAG: DoxX family protein [Candidatus Taylorbacteria bacterium]|nr:DoxX family protein [Candidatus Taylorbacteria bacterium]
MKAIHNTDIGLLILRIVVGLVFIVHGYGKVTGIDQTIGFFGMLGFPAVLAYVVAYVELLGGISLVIGYGSKISSALLAFTMLVAIIKVHGPKGFNNSEFVLTLMAANLAIFFAGSGKYALGAKCGCPVKEGTCVVENPKA